MQTKTISYSCCSLPHLLHWQWAVHFSNCRLLGGCWGRFWSIFEILVKRQSMSQVLKASKNNSQNWVIQKRMIQKKIVHVMKSLGNVAAMVRRRWIRMMRMIERRNIVWIQSNYKASCSKCIAIYQIRLSYISCVASARYANVRTPDRHVRTRLYFTSVSLIEYLNNSLLISGIATCNLNLLFSVCVGYNCFTIVFFWYGYLRLFQNYLNARSHFTGNLSV